MKGRSLVVDIQSLIVLSILMLHSLCILSCFTFTTNDDDIPGVFNSIYNNKQTITFLFFVLGRKSPTEAGFEQQLHMDLGLYP